MLAEYRQVLLQAGAIFDETDQRVLHFGSRDAEYRALREKAAVVPFIPRAILEISGQDRAVFLHNMCSNEIRKLSPGKGCEAYFLNARGHLLGHSTVYCRTESLVLETVAGQETPLMKHLDRYIIREQVRLEDRSQIWGELLVGGAAGADCLKVVLRSESLPELPGDHQECSLGEATFQVHRVGYIGTAAWSLMGMQGDLLGLWQELLAAGGVPCGWEALNSARLEAGFPWYGVDITDKNLPQEVDRDARAISFVKGCYIGQETVARIDALGHVNKLLRGVRFEGTKLPDPGTELFAEETAVGEVTSACFSPHWNSPMALAYVRRSHIAVGSKLRLADGTAAEIVEFLATTST